ncbi:MAG: hypothetical protein LBG60_16815 [Bifidobacteriaceae bacterium]|jgi:hypothetical protein|nr:hypothetical protein [Bifidobacteriaceae bacterium]
MPFDVSDLDRDWWEPHFNAAQPSQVVALEYLGSERRMGVIHQAFTESVQTEQELVEIDGELTIAQFDEITFQLWWDHMTGAEREVRRRLGEDRGSRARAVTVLGSPASTWQPTPAAAMCWSVNQVRPFPKGRLVAIPPRHQPTVARMEANLRRSQKSSHVAGRRHPGFTLAVLDDGYPHDPKVLSALCEQVANDLMLNEPTANLANLDTHVLLWAARCSRKGLRP